MKTTKQLFSDLGIVTKRESGSDKVLCPKCSQTRKHKNDPCLSIDLDEGFYNCHNPGCDFRGKVFEVKEFTPKVKDYVKPIYKNNTDLSTNLVQWFFKRGISQKTLIDAKITEGKVYMPQTSKEENAIQFNYFRDGELVNVKYRDGKKHFRMIKDAELVFYGLDEIKESDWCVIVEGEIDKLSFSEAGIKEVISVPNGASKGNSNLEYLDNCVSYFDNKKKIIIATDNDEPGLALREELARRLGYERCFKVDFNSFKDANELLIAKGTQALIDLVKTPNLVEFPIAGIITVNSIWDDVENVIENGLSRGDTTKTLKEFDELVSFCPGHLMVLTGIPNHGKSPFALQIMVSLSVHHGYKWGLFTPEHKPLTLFIVMMCECLFGRRIRKGVAFSKREREIAKAFINEHFYFIEPEDEDVTLENILKKAKLLVVKYGIRGFLLDPWNKLEHNIEKGDNETTYISKQLDKIIRFDQRHGIFTIVVAHPVKIRKDKSGAFEVPNLYDILGSSNWFNKPDIGVTFYRNYATELSEIHVQKMKYTHLGSQGMVEVRYNPNNSRFNSLDYPDNSNWLIKDEPQISYSMNDVFKNLTPINQQEAEPPF
jgi:twinkle protein